MMLGVLSHKIKTLEEQVNKNTLELLGLKTIFTADNETESEKNEISASRIRLLKLQAEIKQLSFQFNTVTSKLEKHEKSLFEIKSKDQELEHHSVIQTNETEFNDKNTKTYNPFANEFFPRDILTSQVESSGETPRGMAESPIKSVIEDANDQEMEETEQELAISSRQMPFSTTDSSDDAWVPVLGGIPVTTTFGNPRMMTSFTEQSNLVFKSVTNSVQDQVVPDVPLLHAGNHIPSTEGLPSDSATGELKIREELQNCVERIRVLEQDLETKEQFIQELSKRTHQSKDHIACKERERVLIDKQEWYEHKLRLLKQDKRRRGETIGKLIRCIDELRDTSRMEQGRVFDAPLVLATALASRGWPPEQRIQATVDAMETERATQRAMATTGAFNENVNPCSGPTSSSNPTSH